MLIKVLQIIFWVLESIELGLVVCYNNLLLFLTVYCNLPCNETIFHISVDRIKRIGIIVNEGERNTGYILPVLYNYGLWICLEQWFLTEAVRGAVGQLTCFGR